ncbi:MAG: hypothetical protein ACOYOU_16310, partial [Kiritimatiellia bacterium]
MRRLSIMLLVLASMSVEIMHAAPQGYRWRAETTDLRPFNIDAFRGETLTLTPTLLAYGVPLDLSGVDSATFYWQTNGSAVASWWSTPATVSSATGGQVRAVWSNACDVGASSYNWFIGLSSSSGASYRVYGRLALRHSPGWSPSAAPPPPALWVSPADLLAVSNALAVALQSLPPPGASEAALAASNAAERAWAAAYTDSATSSVPAQIAAGSVLQAARADYAVPTDILISQSGASGLIVRDGTSCTYTVATYSLAPAVLVISSAGGSQYDGPPIGTEFRYCATSNWGQTAYTNGVGDQVFDSGGIANCWAMQTAAGTWRNDVYMETPLPVTIGKEMHPNPLNYAVLDWKTVTATNWVCLPGNHNTDILAHPDLFAGKAGTNISISVNG